MEENIEKAITPEVTDLVQEAQALNEMSVKVRNLEAQNAELMAAKKKYYDQVLNGNTVEESVPQFRTRDEIRKDLFGREDKDNMSNLDYAKLTIELDDACIRETGESCFLPKGRNATPSYEEKDVAVRMHNALQSSIEQSNDDPREFDRVWARYVK